MFINTLDTLLKINNKTSIIELNLKNLLSSQWLEYISQEIRSTLLELSELTENDEDCKTNIHIIKYVSDTKLRVKEILEFVEKIRNSDFLKRNDYFS
jgi:hypothetical protein